MNFNKSLIIKIYIKIKSDLNLERGKIVPFKKRTKLNKINKYRDQIENRTLTLTP